MRQVIYFSIYVSIVLFCQGCKDKVKYSASSEGSLDYYQEQYRNQYHFSPEANWMNDPNGMVYLDGEYHLFYQYYPDSTVWGPMHWAHSVSQDMIHWEHLPIALYPDSLGYIFSGSAVVDKNNTAGFGKDAIIAIYTYHDMKAEQAGNSKTYQYQAIAYSTDKGRTFTKYSGNPVILNPGLKDFRDPKVIWDKNSNQWVMVFAANDHIKFYGSSNLKDWNHLSDWGQEYGEHGGIWECPDLFPITVKETGEQKWVLLESLNPGAPNGGSGTQYFVGDFNGNEFSLDSNFVDDVKDGNAIWLDYGTDNYAGVTWSNAPVNDDQKLLIGWMSNWQYAQVVPTEKWRSAMTLPRKISLHYENGKYRIRSMPVDQTKLLEHETFNIDPMTIEGNAIVKLDQNKNLKKVKLSIRPESANIIRIQFYNLKGESTIVGYDQVKKSYFIDRTNSGIVNFEKGFAKSHYAPVDYNPEIIEFLIYLDHSSIELFADQGRVVMTDIVFPSEPYSLVNISCSNEANLISGQITTLNSIWGEHR